MIASNVVSSILLALSLVEAPQSKDEPKTTQQAAADADKSAVLAEYNGLRAKTPDTAAAQWKLGLWCEERGLKDLAYVHFAVVARLDPRRDAAWRKLGFKKHAGRWTSDEQLADENEQKKAEKIWAPKLRKLHKDVHGTNGAKKRVIAQAEVDAITDPRAIPAVYREFAGGGQSDQLILIQILGQIDKPLSSRVLAMLAVYGKTPEARSRATATLRGRSAEDFLDILVALMNDPFKYEVKRVGGPGSPGVLFVEGERFNVSRFYAPPAPPTITPQPGDTIAYDQYGMPVITRPVGALSKVGVKGSASLVRETDLSVQISTSQLLLEAQRGAAAAAAQLEGDVEIIKSINSDRKRFNDVVMAVAKDATGKDHGPTPKDWRDALAKGNKSPKKPDPSKPTIGEVVPLAYNPAFVPVNFIFTQRTYVDS
jgi:hypothetical protein